MTARRNAGRMPDAYARGMPDAKQNAMHGRTDGRTNEEAPNCERSSSATSHARAYAETVVSLRDRAWWAACRPHGTTGTRRCEMGERITDASRPRRRGDHPMTDLERAVRRAALIAQVAHIHRLRRLRRPILRWCRA